MFETFLKIQMRHFWGIFKCCNFNQSGIQIFIMFENSAKSKSGVASLTYNVIGSIDPDHFQLDLVWSFIISTLKNLAFARKFILYYISNTLDYLITVTI